MIVLIHTKIPPLFSGLLFSGKTNTLDRMGTPCPEDRQGRFSGKTNTLDRLVILRFHVAQEHCDNRGRT